jgi:hypothetical protein
MKIESLSPDIGERLGKLVSPVTRGDPGSPLCWTAKGAERLAEELRIPGEVKICAKTVLRLLKERGFSLQAPSKTQEGKQHPDREGQFEWINAKAADFISRDCPVLSVDTKKKELVGDFKNGGREWQPKGAPDVTDIHDFPSEATAKVSPYGVYDVGANSGFVNVGISHDTGAFAVASIEAWWSRMGSQRYPGAKEIHITADAGGSNGYKLRLWKAELQRFADRYNMTVHVSHLPPGTSKWAKIEHRLFSFITLNWRGRPLRTLETVVNLISHTTTTTGLVVCAQIDERNYPRGIKITDKQMKQLDILKEDFHGEWNYQVRPRKN